MITNDFNKEIRSISDALCNLGYTDSTIRLCQRYWKQYYHYGKGTKILSQENSAKDG